MVYNKSKRYLVRAKVKNQIFNRKGKPARKTGTQSHGSNASTSIAMTAGLPKEAIRLTGALLFKTPVGLFLTKNFGVIRSAFYPHFPVFGKEKNAFRQGKKESRRKIPNNGSDVNG